MQCGDCNALVVDCGAVKRNVMVSCCDDVAKEWLSVGGVSAV